ncbi:MAG: hypothetical protein J6J64_04620 [Alistipes sp.]|nr:hypothetical protein [Alistipes sp.]
MRKNLLLWSIITATLFAVSCGDDSKIDNNQPTPPTPVVTPEISVKEVEVTPNSYTFEITTNTPGEYGYVYAKDGFEAPSFQEWFAHNSGEITDKATVVIDKLNDNTTYNLYVVLRSAADGTYSDPCRMTFTTPDDGQADVITIDNVTYDTISFTINISGSYVFQCIDKAYLEYMAVSPESYITTPGIGIQSQGAQSVDWFDGGKFGDYDMRVREDSDYYVIAAITNGQEITDQIFIEELRTPKKPHSNAGITTEFKEISSTSVTISTTPDSNITEYYVYVRDKAWAEQILAVYDESMLATLVKSPSAGAWHLTAANEQTWGGLTPSTEYYCMIVIVDNMGAEAFSKIEFSTIESQLAAPEVELSLTNPADNGHNTLSLNIYSADAASVRVAFNTKADISALRNNDLSDEYILNNYGIDLSGEQVEAIRTTGLSIAMGDLFPEVEYVAIVSVKNSEHTATIMAATKATTAKPVPARVESDLFTTLQGEWTVSYSLVQYNFVEVAIYDAPVTIAQGVDATSEAKYREQNRLVILDWPFDVDSQGSLNHLKTYSPADLMEADPEYWGAYPELTYRDYGPKVFLEIGADGSVTVPTEKGEYFYNWSSDGTFYFFGCDFNNEFTAPATFPVTVSADGNTITIGAHYSGEEFGYGVYRPSVFRDNAMWAVATSDIVLKRVK